MRKKVEMDKKSPVSVKFIIALAIFVILLVAHITIPSEEEMRDTINTEIKEAIAEVKMEENDTTNVTATEVEKKFMYYNLLEYKRYGFFAIMHIIDRYSNDSSVGMIGAFKLPMTVADLRTLVITERPALPQKKQRPADSGFDTEPLYTGHDYDIGTFDDAGY